MTSWPSRIPSQVCECAFLVQVLLLVSWVTRHCNDWACVRCWTACCSGKACKWAAAEVL